MAGRDARGSQQRPRPLRIVARRRQLGHVSHGAARQQLVGDRSLAGQHLLDDRAPVDREIEGLADRGDRRRAGGRRAGPGTARGGPAPTTSAQRRVLLRAASQASGGTKSARSASPLSTSASRVASSGTTRNSARCEGRRRRPSSAGCARSGSPRRASSARACREPCPRPAPGSSRARRPEARSPTRAARAAWGPAAPRAPRRGARRARARSRSCSGSRGWASAAACRPAGSRPRRAPRPARPSEKRSPGRSSSTKVRSSGVSQCSASAGTTFSPRSSADQGSDHPAVHLEGVALVRGRRVREEAGDVRPHRGSQHARRLRAGSACCRPQASASASSTPRRAGRRSCAESSLGSL